ncbi:MAG TPA: hypothetical protein VH024_00495 [Candidatus Angelobacter sp.]|nr:hypothetical protein [Candidatus Angelobacter sp.]
MKKYFMMFALGMMSLSTAAFAATTAVNSSVVSPTLQVSATIQSAVQLTLSTGTAAVTHCAVTPAGGTPDYTMDFGTVDALGINNGNCNKFAPTTPGTSNAIYWSDYNLNPVFTSQTVSTNTITAQVTTDFAAPNNIQIVRDSANSSTVPTGVASFTPVSTGTPDTIVTNAASGSTQTRFIGVAVTPANGAGVTGAKSATVTFTLTVQ